MLVENPRAFLGKVITMKVDRPMGSRHPEHDFVYPVNYGFVPDTPSSDGEELDAYALGLFEPVEEFTGVCIAVIDRQDGDHKLILVPEGKSYDENQIRALTEFQERWFESNVIREMEDRGL